MAGSVSRAFHLASLLEMQRLQKPNRAIPKVLGWSQPPARGHRTMISLFSWFKDQRTRVLTRQPTALSNQFWCQEPSVFIFRLVEPCPFPAELPVWVEIQSTCPDLMMLIVSTPLPWDHTPRSCGGLGSAGCCSKCSSWSEMALVCVAYLANSTVNERRNHQKW